MNFSKLRTLKAKPQHRREAPDGTSESWHVLRMPDPQLYFLLRDLARNPVAVDFPLLMRAEFTRNLNRPLLFFPPD